MDKYQNKYRIKSARMQNWDYGSNAMYFVTICTNGRECYFGNIENGLMILSEIGNIAHICWQNIPIQFQNKFVPQSQNLTSIIRGYKIGVTKYARNNNICFGWQPRFHDHIIRNDAEYQRIKNYIINNPEKWIDDSLKI